MSKRIVALSIVALVVVSVFIPGSPLRAASGPFFRGAANIRQQQACQVSWANASGGLWSNAANWSTGAVPGSDSHACINLGGTYTVTLDASTTVRSLTIGAASGTQTLWIKGSAAGSVTLTVTDGLTNSGVIRLESDADGSASNLTVANGVLANGATGVINVNPGSGGARTISAALNNQGDVNVGANLSWNRANSAHANSGDIQLTGGDLTLTQSGNDPSFTNSGVISIASGRSLTIVGGSFSNVNPGSIAGGGTLNINNARFRGVGTIAANVNNAGQLSPGASLGSLTVSGNYTQFAGGALNLELGGSDSGVASDLLNVTGSATLAGALNISRVNGFRPNPCDRFQVLKYASQTGSFGEITGLSLGSGLFLRTDFRADELSLTAYSNVSEVNVHPTSVNVAEGGATATYRLCLVSQPIHDVSVTLSPDSQVTANSASVTFTAAAWNAVLSVVVTAVNDTAVEGQHTGVIAHTVASSDPRYNGVAVPSVTATIADNDTLPQPPVAEDGSATTPEDTSIVITMVATDPDSSTLTYSIVEQPDHGDLGPINGNKVTYTPDANFHGSDDFRFRANDGALDSNIARVTITVTPVNDPPVAQDITVSTDEDDGITITLVATDVDDANLTYSIVEHPAHGDLGAVNGNRVRYEPDNDFVGTDTFKFRANDGDINSNIATVTVHVGQQNQPPVAQNGFVNTPEDTPIIIMLVATDPEGSALTYHIVRKPEHGVLGRVADNPNKVTYTPDPNFNGADSFTFKANDGASDSNVATVSITVSAVNDPPNARDDSATTPIGTPVDIPVLANDSDIDGDSLAVAAVTQPLHGSAAINANNTVRYTPSAGYTGPDAFSYTVSDGHGGSDSAEVTIAVTPITVPEGRGRIEFTGFVQALPTTASLIGTWKVQGLTVRVTEDTELKLGGPGRDKDCPPPWRPCSTAGGSSFGVGSFVEVDGVLLADGVVVAREIELAKPEHPPKPPPPPRDKDRDRDDDGRVTLCHIPPGNSGAAHTITVDTAAARAHLSHGDTLGRCPGGDDD
jgi:hypothetical protein